MTKKPVVLIRFFDDKNFEILFNGDVDVFCVAEQHKNDRVYKMTMPSDRKEIDDILGDDDVGHVNDGRHKAIISRIFGAILGVPFDVIDGNKQ